MNKLKLNKETLRALSDKDAVDLVAGVLVLTMNATNCDFSEGPGCRTKLFYYCKA